MQCYKVFKRVNNTLTSLYSAYPLEYTPNEITKAPSNSMLFCYTNKDEADENYANPTIELWLCECGEIEIMWGDFSMTALTSFDLDTLNYFWENYVTKYNGYGYQLTKWVKPLERVE